MLRKNQTLFLALIALNLLVYHLDSSLVTDDMLYQDMSESLGAEVAADEVEKRSRVGFIVLKYFLEFVWVVVKMLSIVFVLTTGLNAFNIAASFVSVLRLAIPPLFVFLIPGLVKVFWFNLIQDDYSISSLNEFPHFTLSDLLVMGNIISNDGVAVSVLKAVSVENILFCYFFAGTADFSETKRSKVYKAIFFSFFTFFLGLRLLAHLLTAVILR